MSTFNAPLTKYAFDKGQLKNNASLPLGKYAPVETQKPVVQTPATKPDLFKRYRSDMIQDNTKPVLESSFSKFNPSELNQPNQKNDPEQNRMYNYSSYSVPKFDKYKNERMETKYTPYDQKETESEDDKQQYDYSEDVSEESQEQYSQDYSNDSNYTPSDDAKILKNENDRLLSLMSRLSDNLSTQMKKYGRSFDENVMLTEEQKFEKQIDQITTLLQDLHEKSNMNDREKVKAQNELENYKKQMDSKNQTMGELEKEKEKSMAMYSGLKDHHDRLYDDCEKMRKDCKQTHNEKKQIEHQFEEHKKMHETFKKEVNTMISTLKNKMQL